MRTTLKKVLVPLLVVCMLLSAVACSTAPASQPAESSAPAAAPSAAPQPAPPAVSEADPTKTEDGRTIIKYGFSHANYENIAMRNPNLVVTDMIAKYNEDSSNPFYIDLMFTVADSDATKQAAQISDMINAGCDVISIFAVDTTAVLSSVQEATEAGIPTIVTGIGLAESDIKPTATIMCDVYDSGYKGTKAALEMMLEDGYKPEDIRTICIVGALRDNNSLLYRDGSLAALAEIGAPEPMAFVESEWNAQICTERLAPVVEANPDVNFIICPNSDQVMACETVLSRIDRWHRRGEEGHIYMSANCSMPHALEYLCEGYLDADVTDVGNMYDIVLEDIIKIGEGRVDEVVDQKVILDAITRENFVQLRDAGKLWSQPFWSKPLEPVWEP